MQSNGNLHIPSFTSIPANRGFNIKGISSTDFNRLWDSTQHLEKTSLGAVYDSPEKFKLSSRFNLRCTQKSLLERFCGEGTKKKKKSRELAPVENLKKKFIFETLNNREVFFKFDPDCPGVFTLKSIQEVIKSTNKNPGSPSIKLKNSKKRKLRMEESILSSSSDSDSERDSSDGDTNKYVQYPSVI